MAYKGGIDFIDHPFRSAEWEVRELTPPWTRGGNPLIANSTPPDGEVAIEATVRNFDVSGRQQDDVKLSYDTERRTASDGQRAQCVIMAKASNYPSDRERRYHVLLVMPTQAASGRGMKTYERVGVGYMLGKFIKLECEGARAWIV